jgi:hypothetical protein
MEIINQLRRSSNISMVLASAKGSSSTIYRPSDLENTRSLLDAESGLEFELVTQHNMVYSVLEPIDVSNIDINDLIRSAPRYPMHSPGPPVSQSELDLPNIGPQSYSTWSSSPGHRLLIRDAPHTTHYCDARLSHISIGYWTATPVTDELAASSISMYLVNDHPVLGFFDADLFLDDLMHGQLNFCCPFLVCSLLYLSFVSIFSPQD